VDDTTLAMMKKFESFVPSPKSDGVTGKITVDYGHVCQKTNCTEITFLLPLSEPNTSLLLNMDLLSSTKCVNTNTGPRVVLNDNQFGALSSFACNAIRKKRLRHSIFFFLMAGCSSLTTSTLLTGLNNGEDPNTVAGQELPKFNKATLQNGTVVVVPGLTNRHAAEVTVFQTSSRVIVHP
ncbi:glycoside hydrolase family 24 protein, partial [Mycena rebaudengoi]